MSTPAGHIGQDQRPPPQRSQNFSPPPEQPARPSRLRAARSKGAARFDANQEPRCLAVVRCSDTRFNWENENMKKLTLVGMTAAALLCAATPISLQWSPEKTLSLSVDKADAR
jgi:hypothetical protein